MLIMGPKRRELLEAINAAAKDEDSPWTALRPDNPIIANIRRTIRYTDVQETPDYVRKDGWINWDRDTYPRFVFITFYANVVLLRVTHSPWVDTHEFEITLRRAFEVLADPTIAFKRG
jgi:hypothetical protein